MSGASDVRIALETRSAALQPVIATQNENSAYTPVAGVPYQQIYLLLSNPDNSEMSPNYQERGFLQINLRYPANVGSGAALARAQAIREWFPKGLTLIANGLTVYINRTATISPALIDGDRYQVSVRVWFFSNN